MKPRAPLPLSSTNRRHRRRLSQRNGPEQVYAAAEAVALVNQNPALWPLLNELSLDHALSWPDILRELQRT